MRTALYRHFDITGQLLYVGISLSAVARLAQHRTTAHWFGRIARIDIEWHETREAALEAEIAAIVCEAPLCNIVHAGGAQVDRAADSPPSPQVLSCDTYAIEHLLSGRRNGNYFERQDAQELLAWFRVNFPGERFRMVFAAAGDPEWPTGASNGAPSLRAYESEQWSASA